MEADAGRDGGHDAGRDGEGSGVLLLRAWLHDGQVVARARHAVAGEPGQHVEVVLGAAGVEGLVRRWLAAVERGRRGETSGGEDP